MTRPNPARTQHITATIRTTVPVDAQELREVLERLSIQVMSVSVGEPQ